MIIPITGKVAYSITLDPTVWIFDDRKVLFDKAFDSKEESITNNEGLKEAAQRWNRAIYPPINKGMTRQEKDEILQNSYVMPLIDFIERAEVHNDAAGVTLSTINGDITTISIQQLKNGFFLFAVDGRVIKDEGPVHFYLQDGSNKDTPIKGIQKIIFT